MVKSLKDIKTSELTEHQWIALRALGMNKGSYFSRPYGWSKHLFNRTGKRERTFGRNTIDSLFRHGLIQRYRGGSSRYVLSERGRRMLRRIDWHTYLVPARLGDGLVTLFVRHADEGDLCNCGDACGNVGYRVVAYYQEAMAPNRKDECGIFCRTCWFREERKDREAWHRYRKGRE